MAVSIISFLNEKSAPGLATPPVASEKNGTMTDFARGQVLIETGLLTDDDFSATLVNASNQLLKVQGSNDPVAPQMGNQLPLLDDSIENLNIPKVKLVDSSGQMGSSDYVDPTIDLDLGGNTSIPQPLSAETFTVNDKGGLQDTLLLSEPGAPVDRPLDTQFMASVRDQSMGLVGDIQKENRFSTAIQETRFTDQEKLNLNENLRMFNRREQGVPADQSDKTFFVAAKSPFNKLTSRGEIGSQAIKAGAFIGLAESGLTVERSDLDQKAKALDFEPFIAVKKESKINLSKSDVFIVENQPQTVKRILLDQDTGLTYSNVRANAGKINAQPATNSVPTIQTLPSQPTPTADQNYPNLLQQGLSLRGEFSPNLTNRVQWIYQQALSSAEIMMDPPELGPLTVKLKTHHGETSVLFQVNNSQTKDMIEDNMSKLKEMLEQQGLRLGDAQVEHKDKKQGNDETSSNKPAFESSEAELNKDETPNIQSINILDAYA